MKRLLYFACICLALVAFSSCNLREDGDTPEGDTPMDLSEFQPLLGGIDLSRENQFQEAFIYGDWVTSKIMREVYIDGVLKERFDITESGSALPFGIVLRQDHTVGTDGIWVYAYNCILIKDGSGGYGSFEVANAESGLLWLKKKVSVSAGAAAQDMSEIRQFNVFELKPRDLAM